MRSVVVVPRRRHRDFTGHLLGIIRKTNLKAVKNLRLIMMLIFMGALGLYLASYLFLSVQGRFEPSIIGLNGVKEYAWANDISDGFLLASPQRQLSSCIYAAAALVIGGVLLVKRDA